MMFCGRAIRSAVSAARFVSATRFVITTTSTRRGISSANRWGNGSNSGRGNNNSGKSLIVDPIFNFYSPTKPCVFRTNETYPSELCCRNPDNCDMMISTTETQDNNDMVDDVMHPDNYMYYYVLDSSEYKSAKRQNRKKNRNLALTNYTKINND